MEAEDEKWRCVITFKFALGTWEKMKRNVFPAIVVDVIIGDFVCLFFHEQKLEKKKESTLI